MNILWITAALSILGIVLTLAGICVLITRAHLRRLWVTLAVAPTLLIFSFPMELILYAALFDTYADKRSMVIVDTISLAAPILVALLVALSGWWLAQEKH